MAKKQTKRPLITVDREGDSATTVSMRYKGRAFDLSNDEYNRLASKMLERLAKEVAKAEFEFDGVEEPSFDDDKDEKEGTMSLTAIFFMP